MSDKSIRAYTVHCAECLKVLGISIKNFQDELIFCSKCGKPRILEMDFEKERK